MEVAGLIKKLLPDAVVDDAVLDAIALSACADGIVKEEMDAIRRMARELPSSTSLDDAALEERIHASFARIHDDGLDARLEAIAKAALDDDTRKRMFTAAAIVQYADGHVTNEENEFLLDLADALGLDENRVRAIVAEIEVYLAGASPPSSRVAR